MPVSVYLFSKLLLMTLIISKASSACVKVQNEEMIEYSCENGTQADLYSIPERTEKIRITNIDLSHVTGNTFGRFGDNLWVLSCSHCSIKEIDDDAFKTLTNLQQLRLDNNNLRTVKAKWFQGLKYLTYLDFNYNGIETIEDGVFVNLPGLVDLRIAGNKLQCLNVDEMSRLTDLKRVFLNRNPEFKCPNAVNKLMESKNINYERDDAWEKITYDLVQPKSGKLVESVTEAARVYERPETRTEDPRIYERPESRVHDHFESRTEAPRVYDPRIYDRPEDPRTHQISDSKTEDPRVYERPEDPRIYERPESKVHDHFETRTEAPRVYDPRIYDRPEDPRTHQISDSKTEDPRMYERPEDPRVYDRPEDPRTHQISDSKTEDPRMHERPEDPRAYDPRLYERPEPRTEDPRVYETPESRTHDPRIYSRPEEPNYELPESRTEIPRDHERPEMIDETSRNHPRPELITEPPKIYERFDLTNPPEVYENYETTPIYRERLIITHNPEFPSSTSNINYPVTSIHYPTSVTYPDKSDVLPTSTYSRPDGSRNFPDIATPPAVQEPYNEPYYPRSSTSGPYNEINYNSHRLPTSTSKISWTSNSEDVNTFDEIYYPIETDPLSREDNHNVNYPEHGHHPTRPYDEEKELREELTRLALGNPHTLENYQQVDEMPPVTIFTAGESTNGPVITTTTDKPLPNCSSSASIGLGTSIAIICLAVSHSILRTI